VDGLRQRDLDLLVSRYGFDQLGLPLRGKMDSELTVPGRLARGSRNGEGQGGSRNAR
jgi:hypothetical protein